MVSRPKVVQTAKTTPARRQNSVKPTEPVQRPIQSVNFLYPNRRPPNMAPTQPLERNNSYFGVRVGNAHRGRNVAIANGQMRYYEGRGQNRRHVSTVQRLPNIVRQVLYSGKHRIQFSSPYSSRSWNQVLFVQQKTKYKWAQEFSSLGYVQQSFRCSVMANHLSAQKVNKQKAAPQPKKIDTRTQQNRMQMIQNHRNPSPDETGTDTDDNDPILQKRQQVQKETKSPVNNVPLRKTTNLRGRL